MRDLTGFISIIALLCDAAGEPSDPSRASADAANVNSLAAGSAKAIADALLLIIV